MITPVETGTGVRERKKTATRQALHEAALRLAMEFGVERVTSEAVADAAGVSRRTFSNYFANKEEALLHGDQTRMRELLGMVAARPAGETAWDALAASAVDLLAETADRDPDWVLRVRLLRRHPSLAVYRIALYTSLERELAAALAERVPPDDATGLRSRLIAATFLAALRIATDTWVDQPAGASLRELVATALRTVGAPFDG
jgi:AcrR family transcriptional regulator